MSTVTVAAPAAHISSQLTARANRMLCDAGVALQKLASENTEAFRREVDLEEKLSSAQRRDALWQLGVRLAAQGEIKISSVGSTVDRWYDEGRAPEYYADLHSARLDLNFAAAGAQAASGRRQDVDKTSSARQDGSRPGQSDHFDYRAFDHFLATQG